MYITARISFADSNSYKNICRCRRRNYSSRCQPLLVGVVLAAAIADAFAFAAALIFLSVVALSA